MHFLVVDDHALIVQALGLLLKSRFPGATVYTGSSALDARALVEAHGAVAELFILDLKLPGLENPTELLEEFVQKNPTLKILVLSGLTSPEEISHVLRLGAAGFVPKSLETEMLTQAIDFVLQGGVYVPTKLLTSAQRIHLLDDSASSPAVGNGKVHLTDRQKDVLSALARGLPIKSICRELDLSEGTVKTHVTAIYRAFNANNRTQALIAAKKAGFEIAL